MNTILEQVNSIGKAFVEFAVPMLVQSGVLIVILLLIDLALRKKVKAVFRYCIWMLVLLKLILPTSLSSPLSLGYWFGDHLAYVAENQTSAEEVIEPEALEPALANMLYIIEPVPIEVERPAPAVLPMMPDVEPAVTEAVGPPAAPVTPVTWQGVVFLLWLAVVIALGLLLLQRSIFVRGLVAQAKEANSLMNDALEYCCKCMGVKRKVGLKVSANAASPAVCGLFRPVILLPHKLAPSLGSRGLRAVLLHELAHIRRGDLWVNLAQTVLQIMYFYNPLLWVANAMIRRVREQAIDETVLVAMGEKAQQYPQTLVNVAKLAFKRPVLSLRLIGVVESKSALAGRIKHILNRPMPRTAKIGIVGVLAVIIAGAVLLPMAKASKSEPQQDNRIAIEKKLYNDIAEKLHKVSAEFDELVVVVSSDLLTADCRISGLRELKGFEGKNVWQPIDGQLKIEYVGRGLWKVQGTKHLGHVAFTVDTEEYMQQDKEAGPEQKKSQFIATLPNGVTVELVGVCDIPADGKQWWAADGSPVENVYWDGTTNREDAEDAWQMVFRVRSNDSDPDLTPTAGFQVHRQQQPPGSWSGAFVVSKDNQTLEDLRGIWFSLHDDQRVADVSAVISSGPWETQSTLNVSSANDVRIILTKVGKMVWSEPFDKGGKTNISVTLTKMPEVKQIVATDKQGNKIHSESMIANSWDADGNAGGMAVAKAKFSVPLSRIDKFHFQTRKAKHITFKNVSLKLNFKTDVQVESKTDSLDQLGDAPEEVRAIGKVLSGWFESCAAGDLEKVKKAYLPSKSNNAKHDLQRMKQLLEVDPNWQFSLLAVIWDKHRAKAVSHKISHPGADSPLVFVWQLKKFEGQWGIADQFGGGQLNEFGNLEEFLNYLDRYVFCQEYPTGYMWLDTADPNLRLRTNSRKSEAGPFAKSHWPQLDGAPEQVQQIAKVLKRWFAACLAEDAEQVKELYRPNTQRHAEDKLKEMNRILAMAPGWWFSPMMIKFSKSEADAISHPMEKINFPGVSDPMISIVRFKKVEGQWTILSSSMDGLRSLPDSYAYFYRRYPDGQIWFDKSIPDWLKPDQQTGVDVDIEELKGISEKVKPGYSLAEKVRAITGDKEIFESYFTDSNEGGKALDQWWPVRDKDPDVDKKIFGMVRNGLRRDSQGKERIYRNKYIKGVGNKYIWGQKPQKKEAIELMYYASFDSQLASDAIYYGLSVVRGKRSDKILKRLVELCMANVNVDRILWGTKGQHEGMVEYLEPYLTSGDLQIKSRASVLGKVFKGEINYSQWAKEQRRQKLQAEFGEKLPEIREVLLRGNSHQRREVLELIGRKGLKIIFDESFAEPFKACLEDGDPAVREAAIRYGGDLFGKRGECSDEMLEVMNNLSKDWDCKVRKVTAVFIGSGWIWGVEAQNPKAIEIMMELSKDKDREVREAAVYYGLSVVENKSDKVIKRLIEMALDAGASSNLGRIGWGLGRGADKEKIKMYLMPYLEPGNRKGERARQLYREMFKAEPPNSPKEETKENGLVVKASALQSLIDSARAGDTVIVPEGVYTEPIEITKSLTLKGQSRAACVFEVTANRPAVFVDTKGKGRVTIEELTIKWQLATSDRHEHPFAVAIKDTKAEVKNCNFVPLGNFQRSPVAIRAMGFSNLTINTCRFEGFEYTVCYGEGTEGTIQDSLVMGSGHQGISLYSGATVKIIRNVVTGSRYHGVRSTGGTLDMKDNLIIENANRGVYLGNKSAHGTITNNIITGNRLVGISGFAQSDVKIYNNLILDSGRVGIGAQPSCRFLVKDNIIKGNPSGIVVFLKEGAKRGNLLIRRNTFWNNETDTENCEKAPLSISEEPAFRDPANGDFSLTGGKILEQKQGLTDPKVFKALWKRWKNRADKTDVQVEGESDVSKLVEQLQSENRRERCDAARKLESLGDRRGVPAIIKELADSSYRPADRIRSDGRKDQEGQVRQDHYYAALLLGILKDKRAVPALIRATRDETIDYQAALSLGQIGDTRAIPALHDMLERCSDKAFPHLFAGYGLAMLGDNEGLKVVIDTLNDHQVHWTIRRHAIEALGKLGDKEAVPYLIAALKDEDANIRVSSAKALGEIGDVSALPALKQALEDKTETKVNAPTTVSEAAAKAIAQIESWGQASEHSETNTIVPGIRVGVYTFGMSKDDVLKSLGEPKSIIHRRKGYDLYFDGICFNIVDDSVNSIAVLGPFYKFTSGLGVGSSEQQIIQAFGNDFYLEENEGKDFLTYKDKGLVFEIYKDKRTVMEISVLKIADSLNPSQKTDVQVEGESGWGEAVEGLQVRLRTDKMVWKMGETPKLNADIRNLGNDTFWICTGGNLYEINVDGQWYSAGVVSAIIRTYVPGCVHNNIPISLDKNLFRNNVGKPLVLELSPGEHVVQVAFRGNPTDKEWNESVRFISNPVEIEILPAEKKPAVQVEGDFHVTRQKFLRLLALPEPQLRHAREAIQLFKERQDWPSLAIAYEVAAETMWRVTHMAPEAFTRPVTEQATDVRKPSGRGGPYVMVQTNLDGEWVKGKGERQNWIDWIERKQKDLALERIAVLKKLGALCLDRLDDPPRAVLAYEAAGRGVPVCTEPLETLIAQMWPVMKVEANEVLALDHVGAAHIRLEPLQRLAEAQVAAGNLRGAADTRLRAMLTALIDERGDWNAHYPTQEAEAFWQVVRRLPLDQPLPPTLWLRVLDPQHPEIAVPAPEDEPHGYPISFPGPRLVIRPGHTAQTLTVSADMETPGGKGGVRCFTIIKGKVREIGWVQWHRDGRRGRGWRQGTFDLPEDVGVIRLEITPFNGTDFHVRNLKVEAAFAASGVLPSGTAVQVEGEGVLWNNQCPHSFAETLEEGESLKKEIPDFHRDLRLPLGWQVGKTCTDPNEQLSKEILLTKKVLFEVFKPQIVPLESIDDKFLLLSNLSFKDGKKRETLVVRFKKDKYIIKIMKTIDKEKGKIFITVRLTSKEAINIKELSGDIFNERILPAKWERPLYSDRLKRESKILSAGAWMAKDTWTIDSSGKIICADSRSPAVWGPIGKGRYKRIDFYTNGKFVSFRILGGPPIASRALTDSKKKDGE